MRKTGVVLNLIASVILFCPCSFAATEYVIVNNGSYVSNSATLYELNTRTGHLKELSVLRTGGQAALGEAGPSQVEEAVNSDASCIFVFDDGSSDIAAFSKTTRYKRVGKYFKANLIAGIYGGSLSLTPNGRFLYAGYSFSALIGAWQVNSDCTLTFISAYNGAGYDFGPIKVSPNGKYLVVSSLGPGAELDAINDINGTLTSLNGVSFIEGACARIGACQTFGLDITKDSKFAVFSSYTVDVTHQHNIPVALTARITSNGLTNPRVWVLHHSTTLAANNFPFFSAAAYAGSGNIYFGTLNAGGYSPGVLTATFTEHPMSFAVIKATVVDPQVDNIAVTGNLMVIAQYPNQIGVFRIMKDGSLRLLSTTRVNMGYEGLFSLSIFPNTR